MRRSGTPTTVRVIAEPAASPVVAGRTGRRCLRFTELPTALATIRFFGAFMPVIKRAYNLDVEIRAEREQLRTAVLREQVEQEKLSEELASQLRRIELQLQED